MRIALSLVSLVGGASFLVVGVVAMKWYAWDVVIGLAGKPDRSMLFWGLPILFIGILAVTVGLVLIVAAIRGIRSRRE